MLRRSNPRRSLLSSLPFFDTDPVVGALSAARSAAVCQVAIRMKATGLWLSSGDFDRWMRTQRTLGSGVERDLVIPILGTEDHNYLTRPATAPGARRPARLPLILSFGWEMGLAIHSSECRPGDGSENAASLCALFNLGIALFDRVSDRARASVGELAARFDEAALLRLCRNRDATLEIGASAAGCDTAEVRIVLKLIGAFFALLHRSVRINLDSTAGRHLQSLLVAAYQAQVLTGNHQSGSDQVLDAAIAKSTLPFRIMLEVCRACATPDTITASADAVVDDIGKVFMLVDDLSDVVRDYRSGDVNTLLIAAGIGSCGGETPGSDSPLLSAAEDIFRPAVNALCESLERAVESIRSLRGSPSEAANFCRFLCAYVQSWMNVRPAARFF